MVKKLALRREKPARWYYGADVPTSVIRRFAREVANRFKPDKIVLFGSYAYGQPNGDSDVDILVIMPCRNEHDQAYKILCTFDAPFAMDLIVRKPRDIKRRLEDRDVFHTHIMTHSKVLYEKSHPRVDRKSGRGSQGRRVHRRKQAAAT
ncbi:MAG TPA: nucleotidyltransferase domain-containing protein [Pirellulaceae bacterium]|jgi:predicted nucleotidyltransferase